MSNAHLLPRGRIWLAMLAFIVVPWLGGRAFAQDDPPGRVGRLVEVQGAVSRYDGEQGQWTDAERNRPLTTGDRLYTDARATAEVRIGSTVVRLSEATELELLRVDDDHIALRLHRGSLALQVRAREVAAEIELVTAEASLRPQRSGLYRLDRADDVTQATALRGALRVDERGGFTIETGQRLELWREGDERGVLRSRMGTPVQDGFTSWVMAEDRRDDAGASQRYVSPEMTGAEDLDRHGSWEQHPEYGAVWLPLSVGVDWAPYRYGRWAWVQPWGWTWVDDAPWGFAPFHYGRWVHWGGRWAWSPGGYVRRPVYAPALVAWVGGPHLGVSVNLGSPAVAWVPLAPREVFRPWYRATPLYADRVNQRPLERGARPPQPVPAGPVMYGNQGVPGAVTVVPRDVLMQRQPVAREALGHRDGSRGGVPLSQAEPPARGVFSPMLPLPPSSPLRQMIPVPPNMPLRENRPLPPTGQQPGAAPPVVDLRRDRSPSPVATPRPAPMPGPAQGPVGATQTSAPQRPPATPPGAPVPPPRPVPVSPAPVAPPTAAPQPQPQPQPQPHPAPTPAPAPAPAPAPPQAAPQAPAKPPVVVPPPQPRPRPPEADKRREPEEGRKAQHDGRGNSREREAVQ